MTPPAQQEPHNHPHKDCDICQQFFKCDELPPCSRPTPSPDAISNFEFAKGLAECLGDAEEYEECLICPLIKKCTELTSLRQQQEHP